MSGRKMHADSNDTEEAPASCSRLSNPNEHTNYDLNTTSETSAYKSQLQHIIEESYPSYHQLSENETDTAKENKQTTALGKGYGFEGLKEVAEDDRLDEVVLRPRPRRTELTDTIAITDRSSDQVLVRSKARNATNLRTNSYGSTQDLRPSSMTHMSSTPKSANILRDLRKSINVETRALPMLRPLSTGRPLSASMFNLSRTGSLDFGGSEQGIFSSSTYGPRATKTDYPKTRQKNGSPFQVDVLKGIAGIGIKVKVTPKGYAQVTDIQRGGPVDKNGQVRVGDNVLFVNTTELTGHTDARVQQVLRLLPRGLTKLVISSATSPESQVQNNDSDKFKTTPSQQLTEQQSPPHSLTNSKELFSLSTNGNDALNNNKSSSPHFAPSLPAATTEFNNSSRSPATTEFNNSSRSPATTEFNNSSRSPATTEFNNSSRSPATTEFNNSYSTAAAPIYTNISPTVATSVSTNSSTPSATAVPTNRFTETGNSGAIETTPMKHPNDSNNTSHISRPGYDLLSGEAVHKHDISPSETDKVYSRNVNVHGQKHITNPMRVETNTVRTQLPPPSQATTMISRQKPAFDTSINMSESLTDITPNSIGLSKSTTESTFIDDPDTSNQLLSRSIFLSDNIDQSPLVSDNVDQSVLSSTNNDNSTLLLYNFDQSTLSPKNTGQPIFVSNNISQLSENTDVNVTDTFPLTANEFPLTSATAREDKLQTVESPLWPASPSTESTTKIYRGMMVTLVDSVDGEESAYTKPEPRMRTDGVNLQATKAAEPSAILDHRNTSASITPTGVDTKTTHNKMVSEHPVPKKRTLPIQNINTDNSKEINTSLIPIQDRRKNKVATLPHIAISQPRTSPLLASRSLSVSTPALNPRKINSLEHSIRNNDNTHYQARSVLSPVPKNAATDLSMNNVSHSRVPPRYTSRSISVSSPALSPKTIIQLDNSSRDSESINYHNKAVLSPAPLNSALSPRRTPSDASHAPAFIYPTQSTHSHKADPSGRLSGGKNRTVEHPHAYKTVQSQLYRAVHPDIYKSTSVTLLDKTIMPQDHESSNRGQSYNVAQQPHQNSSTSTSQARASPFNTEATNKESLDITIKKFDDLLIGPSFGRPEASPADILLCSDVENGFSSSIKEEMKVTDNVMSQVSDIKRPVAPARRPRKLKENEIDKDSEDIVAKQLTNTHIQKTKGTGIKEQKPNKKEHIVVNPTSDLLSNETPTSNDLTSHMLEEKQLKSNEEYLNGRDSESDKTTNILHQNETRSKHVHSILDEVEKPLHLSYSITNTSSDSYVNENSSNIIHNTSTNVVGDSENLLQDHPHKKHALLQSQSVFNEDESATNIQINQNANDKGHVNSFTEKLIAKADETREDETGVNTLQNNILSSETSQIVNDVMMTQRNYSILSPPEVAIHLKPASPESDDDEPPPLPDIPPPLPDVPPPSFIHGDIMTQQWREQNKLYVIPNNSIESKVEKKEDTTSNMSLKEAIESNTVQLEVNLLNTGEIIATDLSDLTHESRFSKSSTEPRISNDHIDHAREDIRVNSPSPIDMLSEDSGMPADEDQEVATDDTTSTPGELADNTCGLDSLKHVPCLSDIEAGLFPSSHEVSLPLLSTSEQETHNFVTGSEKGLDINFNEMSHQNVDMLDLLSEDNIIGNNLPTPILPVSVLPNAEGITVPPELVTENSTAVQAIGLQSFIPENDLLATNFSNSVKQQMLPPTPVNEDMQEPALFDNSLTTRNADISNEISSSPCLANVPGLHVSESPENITEIVISKRKWYLTSNTSASPVLTAEAGAPVRTNYTEKTLLKALPYDAFIRLVERANAVLDSASAPHSFTLFIVHLHREEDIVPLGVDLKHKGRIWFQVSGIKNGCPVWKEGSTVVGDFLLAVDSLWCDNVTVNRFLSRLSKPKHDSLLVLCRQHEGVDTTDSPIQGGALSSMQHKPLTNDSQRKHPVLREELKIHSHFSETAEALSSKLISSEVMTQHVQQLQVNEKEPLHHKQSLPLEEQAHESLKLSTPVSGHSLLLELEQSQLSLGKTQPHIDNALLVENVSSPSELVSSLPGQLPTLPVQEPPLQGQALHLMGEDLPLQRQSPPLYEHTPLLPGVGPQLRGQVPPLPQGALSSPNIDQGTLILHEETPFQIQNLPPLQQAPLLSQLNTKASASTDPQLQPVQSEQTFPVSKRAQVLQKESLHSPLQERSARSTYNLRQNQPQSRATLNEDVSVRRLPIRSTRRLSEEQTQSELRTSRRREYLKTASRHSLDEPFKDVPTKETLVEEHIPTETIVNSAELTAELGPGVYKLIIRKGATGVGFCLEGGVGSPKGDLPITIKRIFKGGPAEKSGLLKVNDEILEVNGLIYSKMGHYEAWNHLKSLDDGDVSITIRRK